MQTDGGRSQVNMQLLTTLIYGLRKHLCTPSEGLASGHIFIPYTAKAGAVLLPSRGEKPNGRTGQSHSVTELRAVPSPPHRHVRF